MLKKIWLVFLRDVKVNFRDFLALYIILAPVILGVGINLLVPSLNETTVRLAMLEGGEVSKVEYMEQFAIVELFPDVEAVTERLEERDNVIAILPEGKNPYILAQGNEPEGVVDFARLLNSYHEMDVQIDDTNAEFRSFGHNDPPLKKMLVNIVILMTSVMGGMMISINIVEEKMDKTISAMNVSPISQKGFILGKSMMGVFLAVYGTIALLWTTGYGDVNMGQMMVAVLAVTTLSLLIGFIEGVINDDVMNAAAGIKMVFLPIAAAVAAAELLSDKWQVLFYWVPFYWTYKGNKAILSYSASWPQILGYTVIVIFLSAIVYRILSPRIRKGLSM